MKKTIIVSMMLLVSVLTLGGCNEKKEPLEKLDTEHTDSIGNTENTEDTEYSEAQEPSAEVTEENVQIDYKEISDKFQGVYLAEGEDASKEDADIIYLYAYGDSLDGNKESLFLSENNGDVFNYEAIKEYVNNQVIFSEQNPQSEKIVLEYVDKNTIVYKGTTYIRDTSYDSAE